MKKIIFMTTITTLLLASVGGMQSCRKKKCHDPQNPDCENYDPCWGKKATSAEFEIASNEAAATPPIQGKRGDTFFTDTIFRNSVIRFKANDINYKIYTWKLGAETINEYSFDRSFSWTPYGKFKVSLIAENEPNSICFPKKDGKDTVVKYFYTKPLYQFPIIGKYKVLFKGATDSSLFEIQPIEYFGQTNTVISYLSETKFVVVNPENLGIKDTAKSSEFLATGSVINFSDGINPSYFCQGSIRRIGNQIIASYYLHGKFIELKGRRLL